MIFDENASCTHGRDSSLVGVESSDVEEKVVLVLWTASAAH
jgi:hypothetical protein